MNTLHTFNTQSDAWGTGGASRGEYATLLAAQLALFNLVVSFDPAHNHKTPPERSCSAPTAFAIRALSNHTLRRFH